MTLKEIMEMNPVLITGVATSFVGVCGALGAKDLLAKIYERYCKKEDEKDADHQKLDALTNEVGEIGKALAEISATLKEMKANDIKGFKNDLKLQEKNLIDMQNRAIAKDKVSNECMPTYLDAFNDYCKLAEEIEGYEISQSVLHKHQRVLKLVEDGKVVDSLKEWYQ